MADDVPLAAESQRKAATDSPGTEVPERQSATKLASRGPSACRGEVKERILRAAHDEFLERGYDATTMSRIAAGAGCTPAMVTYYFDSKQRLFRECFNLPVDPAAEILTVLAEGRHGAGERIARRALQFYEEDLTADTMRALIQALLTDSATSQRFRDYIRNDVLGEVGRSLGITQELAEEIEFAMATSFGVITMRYIVKLEPLASMPRERLERELAPVLQHRIDRAYARIEMRSSHPRSSERPRD